MDTTLGLKYLSALLPIAMGVGVIFFERLYTKWKYSPRGVSPSYFASVALLFALFSSLIFSEVWGKITKTNALMSGHPHMQTAYYNELESVREAWFERRELRKQHIPSTKIAVLFLFGFFTQLAIAFSHIGNNNATRATVMLFSLAFATSIALLAYIDNPHQTSYLVGTGVLDDIR